ncbi:MAG: ABC transporter ATP-binding protein [Gammaproteobacteria bacterium]|jgi:ABC-2 type transport system ATP-binding protein/lipopolysaccharide transport system ATP-binding protein
MTIISLKNINLHFPIYGANTRSLKKSIIRVTTGSMIECSRNKVVTVHALKNINLDIREGDRVGLIGSNGAGKSTLLRVFAGIYEPTSGDMTIHGKVSALLDVMLGLSSDSSGYENMTIRGILHGMSFKEIDAKKAEIAKFTELEDYLAMPIRTYSSGMQLRLAFAIATAVNPEILVLDEVVGTGDAHFMSKAKERLDKLITNSKAVILASHDNHTIEMMCNKVIVMKAGEIIFYGDTKEGLALYSGQN